MCTGYKILVLSLVVSVSFTLFAQDEGSFTLPAEIHRPQYGEVPRFPEDYWIGELGRGGAGEEAYQFARRFIEDLAGGNSEQTPKHIKDSFESLEGFEIRNVRIGGGRVEADGSVSFLVRFLGREEAVTGELFLRQREQNPEDKEQNPEDGEQDSEDGETSVWYPDDLILDQRRPLGENLYGPGNVDLTPYERFF
ncbi:MAG: hypothetical protein LBP69_08780 [Treponema sp.]|nr:hypothetical protein [Treponema sp.]